jgi:hypothetical protein
MREVNVIRIPVSERREGDTIIRSGEDDGARLDSRRGRAR